MRKKQISTVSLKNKYSKNIELGLLLTLFLLIVVFQGWKRFDTVVKEQPPVKFTFTVTDVLQTEQKRTLPAPSRPSIPIESENEDIDDDETIESSEINITDILTPPPPPADDVTESVPFISFDEPPMPIGGYAAFQRNLIYPEIARKAGVEGKVYVNCLIDEKGNVVQTVIIKSLGNNGCDEAAIAAIKSVKWIPAKQRDKAVKVWISIPVAFKLK
ncbi:MAG TPA: TonB family protein [bacterium]|nr:TonB family protein [bacterium]HPN44223.1 TonB family protein [bacterium]